MIKFPSIDQFRNTIKDVGFHFQEPNTKPTIEFLGTVKLHGTNAGVGWSRENGIWAQSRNNIITIENDNAGFAKYVDAHKEILDEVITALLNKHSFLETEESLCIFGEWCGKGIQTGVSISEIDRRFVVFGVAYVSTTCDDDGEKKTRWLSGIDVHDIIVHTRGDKVLPLHHILEFPHWTINIDFNEPQLMQNRLCEITAAVELECPVAMALGVSGVGEGVVWTGFLEKIKEDGTLFTKNIRFKVKGDKHSVTKVKTLAAVNVEKLSGIKSFIVYAVTDNRMAQGFDELFTKKALEPDMKGMPELIRWVRTDVLKEESDTLESNGLTEKDINKPLADCVRSWFKRKIIV